MKTDDIVKEIKLLPIEQRMLIIEKAIRFNTETNRSKTNASCSRRNVF